MLVERQLAVADGRDRITCHNTRCTRSAAKPGVYMGGRHCHYLTKAILGVGLGTSGATNSKSSDRHPWTQIIVVIIVVSRCYEALPRYDKKMIL